MPNTYFRFKQFTIHQEQCAMKVSTEACILGAWIKPNEAQHVLDIGTGTGLLALMLAQRMSGSIDAVELDIQAARQADQNVEDSRFSDRINVIQSDIFDFAHQTNNSYDLIVSNPPFFTNSQKSEVSVKNKAKHDTASFDKSRLAQALLQLLSENGQAYVLYPELESKQFEVEVTKLGLFSKEVLIIRNQPNGPVFRIVTLVTKKEENVNVESLNIREGKTHSDHFKKLLSPYYLKL